jgi:hypothetical protein
MEHFPYNTMGPRRDGLSVESQSIRAGFKHAMLNASDDVFDAAKARALDRRVLESTNKASLLSTPTVKARASSAVSSSPTTTPKSITRPSFDDGFALTTRTSPIRRVGKSSGRSSLVEKRGTRTQLEVVHVEDDDGTTAIHPRTTSIDGGEVDIDDIDVDSLMYPEKSTEVTLQQQRRMIPISMLQYGSFSLIADVIASRTIDLLIGENYSKLMFHNCSSILPADSLELRNEFIAEAFVRNFEDEYVCIHFFNRS